MLTTAFLAVASVAVAAAHGGGADHDHAHDGVLALDSSSFDKHVGLGGVNAFVEFYAPWCGHCKALAPEYARVAETFKSSGAQVKIAKVDADAHKDLAAKFDVKGFPTLKFFPAESDKPEDYTGERTAEAIVDFINGRVGLNKKLKAESSAVVALTPDTFDTVMADPTAHKLVEFYAPWCGHCKQLAPIYEKVGAAFEGEARVLVAKVDADKHRDLGSRFGVSGFPTLKYIAPGAGTPESRAEDYNGGREGQDLVDFLNTKSGAARALDGSLLPTAGRLAAFDALAAKFVAAGDKKARKAVEAEAQAAAAALDSVVEKAEAAAYLKIMGKADDKPDYVAKEAKRVAGMLGSDSVTKAKKAELQLKANVLHAFTAA